VKGRRPGFAIAGEIVLQESLQCRGASFETPDRLTPARLLKMRAISDGTKKAPHAEEPAPAGVSKHARLPSNG
jgi:hypothetical protein